MALKIRYPIPSIFHPGESPCSLVKIVILGLNLLLFLAHPAQDVTRFRAEYERSGPMVKGIPPREAVERLKRSMAHGCGFFARLWLKQWGS
jgi:hypothetical protein